MERLPTIWELARVQEKGCGERRAGGGQSSHSEDAVAPLRLPEFLVEHIFAAGIKSGCPALSYSLKPIAIEFDLVNPFRPIGQIGDRKTIHRLDETRGLLGQCRFVGHRTLVYADPSGPRSRRADGFHAGHLVEDSAALRALDDVRAQAHQLAGLNLVAAKRAGKREVEVGLSFEPRCHRPTRPSAVVTGLRIIRCESRPRNTSDGR